MVGRCIEVPMRCVLQGPHRLDLISGEWCSSGVSDKEVIFTHRQSARECSIEDGHIRIRWYTGRILGSEGFYKQCSIASGCSEAFGKERTGKQLASGLDLGMSFNANYNLPSRPPPVDFDWLMTASIVKEPSGGQSEVWTANRP